MAERSIRTETLRAGRPIRVGSVVLLPIERDVLHTAHGGRGLWILADKRLHALVVRDVSGTRAMQAAGGAVSIEALRAAVPGLDAALAAA